MDAVKEKLLEEIENLITELGEKFGHIRLRTRLNYIDHGCRYDQLDASCIDTLTVDLLRCFDKLWTVDYVKRQFHWNLSDAISDIRTHLMKTHNLKFEFGPLHPTHCFIGVEFTTPTGLIFQYAHRVDGTVMMFAYR